MPDFDFRSSASFISSKEGGTPVLCRRVWMKRSSSLCFSVSMVMPRGAGDAGRQRGAGPDSAKQNRNMIYLFPDRFRKYSERRTLSVGGDDFRERAGRAIAVRDAGGRDLRLAGEDAGGGPCELPR